MGAARDLRVFPGVIAETRSCSITTQEMPSSRLRISRTHSLMSFYNCRKENNLFYVRSCHFLEVKKLSYSDFSLVGGQSLPESKIMSEDIQELLRTELKFVKEDKKKSIDAMIGESKLKTLLTCFWITKVSLPILQLIRQSWISSFQKNPHILLIVA